MCVYIADRKEKTPANILRKAFEEAFELRCRESNTYGIKGWEARQRFVAGT